MRPLQHKRQLFASLVVCRHIRKVDVWMYSDAKFHVEFNRDGAHAPQGLDKKLLQKNVFGKVYFGYKKTYRASGAWAPLPIERALKNETFWLLTLQIGWVELKLWLFEVYSSVITEIEVEIFLGLFQSQHLLTNTETVLG